MTPAKFFPSTLALGFYALLFTASVSSDGPNEMALLDAANEPAGLTCAVSPFVVLPDIRITSVTQKDEPVPHCKVAGVIGTETNFELLLPDNWNGKFVMGGGGGFVGSVVNAAQDLFGALQKGYATVGTDTGHQAHSLDASWALNNLERLVNFGHLAVHRTAVNSKKLIESYYGQEIARSYFTGCSRGGGAGLDGGSTLPR